MAKVEGTQNIPSGIWDKYRAQLTFKLTDATIRLRCPFTRPKSREGEADESLLQISQRNRFKSARDSFNNVPESSRSRWYDTAPPWNSYLWYYNWFMLSALMGVTGIPGGTIAVIKQIINKKISVPTGGTGFSFQPAVDPSKVVIMLWGNAWSWQSIQWGTAELAVAWPVYPVWDSLLSSSLLVNWAQTPIDAANITVQIIEYI